MTFTPPDDVVGTFDVEIRCRVRLTITDPSVVTRCVENHDDQGVPQPVARSRKSGQHGTGWLDTYYDLLTRDAVLAHLACNAAGGNNYDRVSRMDGWADLPDDACRMDVRDVEADGDVTLVHPDGSYVSWRIEP